MASIKHFSISVCFELDQILVPDSTDQTSLPVVRTPTCQKEEANSVRVIVIQHDIEHHSYPTT
jgi:hypothetical protein